MLLFHPRVKLFLMDSNLQKHCQMLIPPNFIKYGLIVQTIYLALIIHSDMPKYVYFLCIALVINVLEKKSFSLFFKLNKLPWSCCGLSKKQRGMGLIPSYSNHSNYQHIYCILRMKILSIYVNP